MAKSAIHVKKDDLNPEPGQILASAIRDIDESMKKLRAGPLKRDTLILLIHDASKVARRDITKVLDAMDTLKTDYLK